jgi:hypothetical protein
MSSLRYNSTTEPDIFQQSNTPVRSDGAGNYTVQGYPSSPQKGFIVFIDALGMRRIWESVDPNIVFNKWRDIITRFSNAIQTSSLIQSLRYFNIVSDTIIMSFSKDVSAYDEIFRVLLEPFRYSLSIEFPLRGTISHDIHYLSNLLAIGPAIADAAAIHDQIEMIGIFATPKLTEKIHQKGLLRNSSNVTIYPQINMKQNGTYSGLALNWYKGNGGKICRFLNDQVSLHYDMSIKGKYLNTLNFCNYVAMSKDRLFM